MKSTLLMLILFLSLVVSAQEAPSDSLAHQRIEYIQQALNQSRGSVNKWWYGWLGVYSMGTAFALSTDTKTKQDMALGTGTALIGTVGQLLMPLNTGRDADFITQLPETTPEQLHTKLRKAEELFKSNATKERIGRSWQIHALNETVNLGSGLITWLAYKRSVWDGVSNFLLNSVVTETQLWTQPTRTARDYEKYCRKYKQDSKPQAYKPQREYYLRTYPGGASLSIIF